MDNQFRAALQEVVNLSAEDKIALAYSSIQKLAPEIAERFDQKKANLMILAIFSTSVAADGKLIQEEFSLVKAFLRAAKSEMDEEAIVRMLADLSSNDAYAAVLSLNKVLSPEGQSSLMALVAAVCAIDDRIETSEIAFLTDLYKA